VFRILIFGQERRPLQRLHAPRKKQEGRVIAPFT
jgi:hypothetical protein